MLKDHTSNKLIALGHGFISLIRHQAITWNKIDQFLLCYKASPGWVKEFNIFSN